jgi:N-acetylglucosamine-6-phosphate deacetylase
MHRQADLDKMHLDEWRIDNVSEQLGAVPGALIRGAHDGMITLCLNFDGEHVDLSITREVVRIAGADNIITLTDRVDGRMLASQQLTPSPDNRLLHREDGVVVAGTIALDEQITNMRRNGISEEEIWKMVSINPRRALGLQPEIDDRGRPSLGCFIDTARCRDIFDLRAS